MSGGKNEKGLLNGFIDKLRRNRRLEAAVYAAVALTALVIFFLTGGISCGVNGSSTTNGGSENSTDAGADLLRTANGIETRLAEVLSGIKGAGKVKVMVAFGKGLVEDSNNDSIDIFSSSRTENTDTEASMRIDGVIVIAEGADDIRVRTDIQSAVRSLLGIPISRIGVYKMQP